jgi:hypothetical protein
MAYIDPITGAFVEDGLDALPPGYNRPKPTDAASIARMRAQLNSDEAIRQQPKSGFLSNPTGLARRAMEHMPGAPIAQAALGMASDMFGQVLGTPYGIYQGIKSGEYGKSTGTAQREAKALAEAMRYTPPTQAGRDIYEGVNKIPEVVTGSSMGAGPLPQLLNAGVRLSPDDVRVMGARGASAAREVGDIPRDFSAAQSGLTRLNAYDQPTYGARLQGVAEDVGDVMARRQAMRPDEGVPAMPGFSSFTDIVPDSRMYAVKPGGGNNPLNLGSTLPLKQQGKMGEYLSSVQYDDPVAVFKNQLEKHYTRGIDNRQLLADWEDYLNGYLSVHAKGVQYSDPNGPAMNALKKEAADKFAESYNAGTIGAADIEPTNKKLYTASQIEQVLPAYNSWVMGPFKKYITNQMGTGLATDPLLQAVDQSGMPPNEIFGQAVPMDYEIDSLQRRADSRRNDFVQTLFNSSVAPENSVIGKVTATTPEGVAYENALDVSFYPKGPYSFKDEDGRNTTQFPTVSKLDRNALITDFLTKPEEETGFSSIRKQVFQDLLSGNLDPGKLSNTTPATITRQMIKDKMAEFKEQQLSKQGAAAWIPKRAAEMPTDMEFPDGSKMTIITPEMAKADENMTARDLGQITLDLNQCIGAGCMNTQDYSGHGPYIVPHTGKPPPRGKVEPDKYGYMRRLKNGEIEIASLKDPEGLSKATLELKRDKSIPLHNLVHTIGVYLEDNKPEFAQEFFNNVSNFGREEAIKNAVQLHPEIQDLLLSIQKKSVTQIKGKSNNEIDKAYIPHVVEWLNTNADKLKDVRDLQNLPDVHDLTRSYDAVGKLMDKNQHWYSPTVEKFFDTMENENALPRFFTTDEFALKATERGVDLSAEPKRAEGEQAKYPEGATLFQMDMIDYFEPGAIRKSYGGHDRIISYDPRTNVAVVSEVKRDPNTGEWIDHPTYGGPRSHSTMPTPEEFQRDMGRPMRLATRQPMVEDELANAVQQMEPEAPQQFNRPTEFQRGIVAQNIEDYLQGHFANIENVIADMEEPYATDMRILTGSQQPEARLPEQYHRDIIDALINQDDHVGTIRYIIDTLQGPGYFANIPELTTPQLENILNIVISWTERYPLNE